MHVFKSEMRNMHGEIFLMYKLQARLCAICGEL
jgi:hypothetical protein